MLNNNNIEYSRPSSLRNNISEKSLIPITGFSDIMNNYTVEEDFLEEDFLEEDFFEEDFFEEDFFEEDFYEEDFFEEDFFEEDFLKKIF